MSTPALKPGTPKKKLVARLKTRFVAFWTLTRLIVAVVAVAVVVAGTLAGVAAFEILYANKLRDTWAILYLDLERQANAARTRLAESCVPRLDQGPTGGATATYKLGATPTSPIEREAGSLPKKLRWFELGLKLSPRPDTWTIVRYGDQSFVAFLSGKKLYLWQEDVGGWMTKKGAVGGSAISAAHSKFYLVTHAGLLIHSNTPEINQSTFAQRPLVAAFVKRNLTNSQIEIPGGQAGPVYGFYLEISGTNLVLFAETSKAKALGVVWELGKRFSLILFGLLVSAVTLVALPATMLLHPIRELSQLAVHIGRGDFSRLPRNKGFGELGPLVESFRTMAQRLTSRDQAIGKLMEDRMAKLRMANELAIAKSLQDTFLRVPNLPADHPELKIMMRYQAADECAGDWYACHFDEASGDVTVAIADVSGHGVGSSMFTAIIAALFDERVETVGIAPIELMSSVNDRLRNLALDKIHVTMQIITWRKAENVLVVTNAGHPFPLLESGHGVEASVELVKLRSMPLGVEAEPKFGVATIKVPASFRLLLYTDGLIEGRPTGGGSIYGSRRLRRMFTEGASRDGEQVLDAIVSSWTSYLSGAPAGDDLCILLLERRVASASPEAKPDGEDETPAAAA